eukprot:747268-Hanusia_phi.AAC.4
MKQEVVPYITPYPPPQAHGRSRPPALPLRPTEAAGFRTVRRLPLPGIQQRGQWGGCPVRGVPLLYTSDDRVLPPSIWLEDGVHSGIDCLLHPLPTFLTRSVLVPSMLAAFTHA